MERVFRNSSSPIFAPCSSVKYTPDELDLLIIPKYTLPCLPSAQVLASPPLECLLPLALFRNLRYFKARPALLWAPGARGATKQRAGDCAPVFMSIRVSAVECELPRAPSSLGEHKAPDAIFSNRLFTEEGHCDTKERKFNSEFLGELLAGNPLNSQFAFHHPQSEEYLQA